jgi:hypothetical protein
MDIDDPKTGAEEITSNTESQPVDQTKDSPEKQSEEASDNSQKENPEGGTKTNPEEEAGDSDRFKKRIEDVRKQERESLEAEFNKTYGPAVMSWQAINEMAEEDESFALNIIEKLEKKGIYKPGTLEAAKKNLAAKKDPLQKQPEQGAQQPVQQESENPDLAYARKLREADEAKSKADAETQEQFLQDFEKDRPDIATQSEPHLVRKQIFLEANNLLKRGDAKDLKEAMEKGYQWVLHRDKVLKEYKETGKLQGRIESDQEGATTPANGEGAQNSGHRALTDEERDAAKFTGMTDQEYLKYLESDGVAED